MSKNKINISSEVMSKIKKGQVKMKPKWIFVMGTVALVLGVIGAYTLSVFLVSLISFSLRSHGPMGVYRFQELLASFPVWAVGLAVVGLVLGVVLLKKFEFSYKKNFWFIVFTFIVAVLISGWLLNYLGIDGLWTKQGQMKKMYQKYEGRGRVLPWNSDGVYGPGHGVGKRWGGKQ